MQYIKMGHMFQGKVLGSNHVLRFNDALAHLERKMKTDSILAMEKTGWGRIKMQKGLSLFGNADGDRLLNIFDCNPFNKHLQGPEQAAFKEISSSGNIQQDPMEELDKTLQKDSQMPSPQFYSNVQQMQKPVRSDEDLVTQYILKDAIDQLEKGHPEAYNNLNPAIRDSKNIKFGKTISTENNEYPITSDYSFEGKSYTQPNTLGWNVEVPIQDRKTLGTDVGSKIHGVYELGKGTAKSIFPEYFKKREANKEFTEEIKKQAREQAILDAGNQKGEKILREEYNKQMKKLMPEREEEILSAQEKAGIIQTPYGLVFNPFARGKSKKGTMNTVDNFLNAMRMKTLAYNGPLTTRISGGTMIPQMPATDRFTGMMGFGGRTGGMGAIDTAYSMVKGSTGSNFGGKVNMLMPSNPMQTMGSSFGNKASMLMPMRGGMPSFGGNAASFDERMMPRRQQIQYSEPQQSSTSDYSQSEPEYVEPEPSQTTTIQEGKIWSPQSKRYVRYPRGPYNKNKY